MIECLVGCKGMSDDIFIIWLWRYVRGLKEKEKQIELIYIKLEVHKYVLKLCERN